MSVNGRIVAVLAGLAAVAAVGIGATSSDAGNPAAIKLETGDAVDVVGTRVACFAIVSNAKPGIACVIWSKKNAALPGSYGVGLAVDGTAVLNRIKADGTAESLFKKRLPASRSATAKVYKVNVGEAFGLPAPGGNALGCQVLNITSTSLAPIYRGPKVSCWLATATKPLPNRYGVSISDKMAGVFRFTATSEVSTWGIVKPQPKG